MENKGNFSWGMFQMKMKNVTVFVIFLFALLWINFWYVCCYLNISFYIYGFFLTNTNQYVIYTLYKFVKSKIHSQSNSSILLTFAFTIFYYLLNWKYTQFSVDLGERERGVPSYKYDIKVAMSFLVISYHFDIDILYPNLVWYFDVSYLQRNR